MLIDNKKFRITLCIIIHFIIGFVCGLFLSFHPNFYDAFMFAFTQVIVIWGGLAIFHLMNYKNTKM